MKKVVNAILSNERVLLFLILMTGGLTPGLLSQTVDTLDVNDIRTGISSAGSLFYGPDGNASFEVPKGSGLHSLYRGNLWIGAFDDNDNLRLAAQTYGQSGDDFFAGPLANVYDSTYDAHYHRLWKIDQTTIDLHKANWNTLGYVMPEVIENWPAHGDTSNGEAPFLAPFEDVNHDLVYTPAAGDYPKIRGDQAIFFIINDDRSIHTESGGDKLGVEIHGLVYAFDTLVFPALHQSIFVHYSIFNRRNTTFTNTYLGLWVDYDIGVFGDDQVGCDTILNASFGYNATNNDMAGNYGYGSGPPSVATLFLNQPMTAFVYYDNDFSVTGNPSLPAHYYQYMQGVWKDNKPMSVGGTGYNPALPNPFTTYMFPGDPVTGTGWVAADAGQPNGADRRGLMSHGPFDLLPHTSLCLDVGFIWARDKTGTNLTSLSLMKSRIVEAQNHYLAQNYNCYDTLSPVNGIFPESLLAGVSIYPNPADDQLFISLTEPVDAPLEITVFDLQGRVAGKARFPVGTNTMEITIAGLASGFYSAEIRSGDRLVRKKFIRK
ncbi:MAG: T9SS type A sorting domain-containing protein [Bacteroidia bacterium]